MTEACTAMPLCGGLCAVPYGDLDMDLMIQQLIPETIDLCQNGDSLLLFADGEELNIDHIVRCFPFSTPDSWISLRDRDGTELGLLPTLDGLNTQSRALVEEHLKKRDRRT